MDYRTPTAYDFGYNSGFKKITHTPGRPLLAHTLTPKWDSFQELWKH